MTREQAIEVAHNYFKECVADEDHEILAALAILLAELGAASALETMRSAYDNGIVEELFFTFKDFENYIARGDLEFEKAIAKLNPSGSWTRSKN